MLNRKWWIEARIDQVNEEFPQEQTEISFDKRKFEWWVRNRVPIWSCDTIRKAETQSIKVNEKSEYILTEAWVQFSLI